MVSEARRLFWNAPAPMYQVLGPIINEVSWLFWNALSPMVRTLVGILTESSLLPWKAIFSKFLAEALIIKCLVPSGLVVIEEPSANTLSFGALLLLLPDEPPLLLLLLAGSQESSKSRQIVQA